MIGQTNKRSKLKLDLRNTEFEIYVMHEETFASLAR